MQDDKAEWRELARDMRNVAKRSVQMARLLKVEGALCEAASFLEQAKRCRRWANEYAREYA